VPAELNPLRRTPEGDTVARGHLDELVHGQLRWDDAAQPGLRQGTLGSSGRGVVCAFELVCAFEFVGAVELVVAPEDPQQVVVVSSKRSRGTRRRDSSRARKATR
jgi:hypothetical protein